MPMLVERRTMPSITPIYRSLVWTSIACLFLSPCCLAYSPIVNHRAIAGIWKLKQTSISSSPLKEFTVYPKVSKKRNSDENKEVLLMLKEDGSFQQYSEEQQKVPDTLRFFNNDEMDEKAKETAVLDRYCEFGKLKGKWELVGGKLILAADRPIGDDGTSSSIPKTNDDTADTILEGEVVATTEEGLLDNPVLSSHSHNDDPQVNDNGKTGAGSSSSTTTYPSKPDSMVGDSNDGKGNSRSTSVVDTHLSVPKGQVNVGRFTYPQHHPSFFEAPMFNPRAGGKFELKQVLGTLNMQQEKDNEELEEKFSPSDFYDKTFLLTSSPIPEFQPKGNIRWSIRQNKFVEDPPPKSKKQKHEEEMMDSPVHNIRVLEVKFFANNTFATIGGMGGSAILRGRFSVIGREKDHIWMQVLRFGFGRSVSGSVFSEGKSLTKDDEKAYWGKIEYDGNQPIDGDKKSDDNNIDSNSNNNNPMTSDSIMDDSGTKEETDRRLLVKGSVLFGYGLEPLPVGQFVLTETNSMEDYDEDEDEDDEDGDEEEGTDHYNGGSFSFDPDNVFQ